MRPGSIVICVCRFMPTELQVSVNAKVPKIHKPYTVRELISKNGREGILLEEIKNPDIGDVGEIVYDIGGFREIDTDISELTERLNISKPFIDEKLSKIVAGLGS